MKSIARLLCLPIAAPLFALTVAHAQISHVTVRTPRAPGPPMALLQTNGAPAAAAPAPILRIPRQHLPVRKPAVDKAELQRRVVAFQTQRAHEGFPSAQYELGVRYLKGDGVEKDPLAARRWLTRSAKAGNTNAHKRLQELGAPAPPASSETKEERE